MALSPTAAWNEAFLRADAQIRFLIDIYDGTTHWKATSGSMVSTSDLYSEPIAVEKVAPVGVTLDPLTRETQTQELFVDVQDKWLRPILVNNRLKGQEVTVKLGASELDESDFLAFFAGPIDEIHPIDGQIISLAILDMFAVLTDKKILGYWMNKHPLQILYAGDGSGILEKADVPTALIDTTSLDPSNAVYTGDISHFILSRGGGPGMYWSALVDPTPAFEVANEITQLINGHFVTNEAGQLKFIRFDGGAAAAGSWTVDDILPGSFRQPALDENIINRFVALFTRAKADLKHTHVHRVDETVSQSAYAYPGESVRVLSTPTLETSWLDTFNYMLDDITDSDTSLRIWSNGAHAISGSKDGSPAWATVSASRPVYLLLDSSFIPGINNKEIVKATACSITSGRKGPGPTTNPDGGATVHEYYNIDMTFSGASRGQLGTSASAHVGVTTHDKMHTKIIDITILVNLADEILSRFKNGAPVIELETLLTQYKYQIGDLMNITYDHYLAYGSDGLDGADKWEIVGKEADPYSKPPRIKWTLSFAGTASPTRTHKFDGAGRASPDSFRLDQLENQDLIQPHIIWGLDVVIKSGLVGTVEAGEAAGHGARAVVVEDSDYTFTASKDTYVALDLVTSSIGFMAVNNGAAAPDIAYHELQLAKVVTDGSGITSIVTGADTLPIGNITAIESRLLDDVQDGSTYKRLGSVNASHLAQSASLGQNIVGIAHTLAESEARNHNFDFSDWVLG